MLRKRIDARTFSMTNWNRVEAGPGRLAYRPGLATLVNRLGYTLLALTMATVLHTLARPFLDSDTSSRYSRSEAPVSALESEKSALLEEARKGMTPEEWNRFEAEIREREVARARLAETRREEFRHVSRYVRNAYWPALATVFLSGILPPLATLWQRIAIELSAMNALTVRTRTFWPRTHYIALPEYRRITVAAVERIHGRSRVRARSLGYRWRVNLERDASTYSDAGPVRVYSFEVDHQCTRPAPTEPLPDRVGTFVSCLERITGLRADPSTAVMDYRGRTRSWRGSRDIVEGSLGTVTLQTLLDEPTVHTRASSMDELPPELRKHVEARVAEGKNAQHIEVTSSQSLRDGRKTFHYRDEHGVTHTYSSLEEMPPEIRALLEHMRGEQP